MSTYEIGRSVGMAVGAMIGLVLVVIIMRVVNKDKKLMTEYDEMQKIVRGEAYKISFYVVLILEAVLCGLDTGSFLPAEPVVIHFLPIFLGVTVLSVYCIWKDAFVGLNTRLGRYIVICFLISGINLAGGIIAWMNGGMFADGKLQAPFVNILCGVLFVIIAGTGLLKLLMNRREVG